MAHRISEAVLAWDAAATLERWFEGYMTTDDGRQYKVVQVDHEGTRMIVRVEGTAHLDVEDEEFEVDVVVRKVEW